MILSLAAAALPAIFAQPAPSLYRCANGSLFFAAVGKQKVTLEAFGRTWDLFKIGAGADERYTNGEVTLWFKDSAVTIERDEAREFNECKPAGAPAAKAMVTGSIIYRDRVTPEAGSVLLVRIQELAADGAPGRTIAERSYKIEGPGFLSIEIPYDPKQIDPRIGYAVSARITRGTDLLFLTDTLYPVITGYSNHVRMTLRRVAPL